MRIKRIPFPVVTLAATLVAGAAFAADDLPLPDYPTGPPADLVAPAVPVPVPAPTAVPAPAQGPLALGIVADDAAARGGRAVTPGAARRIRIAVTNTGARELARASVTVALENLRAEAPGAFRVEGGLLRADLAALAPRGRAALDLDVRGAEVPPGGLATARVVVEAGTAGNVPAKAEFAYPVRDCPGAYRAALAGVRDAAFAQYREAADAARRADPALPAGPMFRIVPQPARGAAGEPARLAAGFAARRGADEALGREPLSFTVLRIGSELNQYLSQRPTPGLCAGAAVVVENYRQAFAPVERRLAAIRKATADLRTAGNAEAASLRERALAAAVAAELVAADAALPDTALGVLAEARKALPPRERLADDAAAALSAVELEAWIALADERASRMSAGFARALDAILAAHREACTCAF